MANMITLPAQPRDMQTKPGALRREGIVPGVLYGKGFESQSLQFAAMPLNRVAVQAGTSQLVELQIEGTGETESAFFRQVQRDPVSDAIVHVDLYRVVAGVAIRNAVPVFLQGYAPITETGATVSQLIESVEVECFPGDMPSSLIADISGLDQPGASLKVSDLVIPEAVTLLTDPDTDLVQVVLPSMEIEEEEVEEEELLEGEEGQAEEGEEGPAEEGEETEE